MSAPVLVRTSTGATDAGGVWAASGAAGTAGDVVIVQILQDGTSNGVVSFTGASHIENLAGTDNAWTQIMGPNADGSFPVGSPAQARQFLFIGRLIDTTAPTISGGNSTSEDLYWKFHEFSGVSVGTTLAEVIENGTAFDCLLVGVGGTNDSIVGASGTNEMIAQSFVSPGAATLSEVALYLGNIGPPSDNLVLEIQTDSAGSPSGSVVGTIATIAAADLPNGSVIIVRRTCSIALSASTTYWIVGRRSGTRDANYFTIYRANVSLYSGGVAKNRNNGTWSAALSGDFPFRLSFNSDYGPINVVGTIPDVNDADVTTLGSERLVLNFIGIADDNAISVFAGQKGGGWYLSTSYAEPSGTDGAIALQIGSSFTIGMTPGPSGSMSVGSVAFQRRGMSFVATGNMLGVYVQPTKTGAPTDDMVVEIQTDSGGHPSGSVVNSATIPNVDFGSTTENSHPKYYPLAATLTPSLTYWLVFRRTGSLNDSNYPSVAWGTDLYSNGGTQYYNGSVWSDTLDSSDIAFGIVTETINTVGGGSFVQADGTDGWGVVGFALKPEVSGPATYYGIIATALTFTKAVSGTKQTFGQIAAPFTFIKAVLGQRTAFGQIAATFTFAKEVSAIKRAFGQITAPFIFTKDVSGTKQTFGQIIAPFTFVKDVTGIKSTFGQIVAPFTFAKNVIGQRTTFGQISSSFIFTKAVGGISIFINRISTTFTFNKSVSGTKKTFSQISVPFTFTKDVSGTKQTFGQIVAPFIFAKEVAGQLRTFGQITASFTFVKDVVASKTTFGQIAVPFTFIKSVAGFKTTFGQISTAIVIDIVTIAERVATTFYGIVSAPFTFTKEVIGQRITFGQTITTLTFTKTVSGVRETFGQIVVPFVFTKSVNGVRTALGQIAALFTFNRVVSGQRTTFSRVDLPLIFTDQTSGQKETFGQVGFPINLTFDVVAEMQGIRFGATSMSLVFDKNVAGTKETFGQTSSPYLFDRSSQAFRTTFGVFDRPFTFVKETIGRKETFGSFAFPINANIVVAGRRGASGQIALSLVFGEQTVGRRGAFGRIAAPYTFGAELQGRLEVFSSLDFPIDFVVDVETGRVTTHSTLALELLLGLETAGIIRSSNIILNMAKALYLGSTSVDAIYTDSQKVWPK